MQEPDKAQQPEQPEQPQPAQPEPAGQPQPPQQASQGAGAPAENPGQTLGIVGIVLNAVGINVGGIILGILSRNKSKQAGMPTTLGTVSLIWGIVGTVLGIFIFVGTFALIFALGALEGTGSFDWSTTRDGNSLYEL